jgi:raffinose/stachyose/melibiose transport system substrate-binding protein
MIDGGKLVGGALGASLLAACASEEGTTGGAEGEVSYWIAIENAEQRRYFMKHIVGAFEKQHRDIDLEITNKSIEDIDRLIRTALQAGTGPAIVGTPGPSYALAYIDANLLLPLDKYAEKFNWENKILQWALDAGRIDGKLYSLPTSYETMLIFYNKSLFEEKGWHPPTTREELEALAEEAQRDGIMVFTSGNAEWRPATEWFVGVFWNHYSGPDALFQALTGEIPWTDPVFVEAVELMNSYFQKGWFGGSVEKYFSNRFDPLYTLLGDGKAAMNMEGTWFDINVESFFGSKAGNDNEWDWAPIPALRAGVPYPLFALGIGGTISISPRAENPDAAATFLDWYYSSPKRVARAVAEVNSQPLPVPLDESDFPASMDDRIARQIETMSEATGKGNFGYTTWTFWPPKSDTYVYEEMENVLVGKITPAEYCEGLNDLFKQELSEGKAPPIIER